MAGSARSGRPKTYRLKNNALYTGPTRSNKQKNDGLGDRHRILWTPAGSDDLRASWRQSTRSENPACLIKSTEKMIEVFFWSDADLSSRTAALSVALYNW